MSTAVDTRITLEMLGIRPSVNPLYAAETIERFEYDGYFRRPGYTQLDVFARNDEKFRVLIATEIPDNPGASITNCIGSVAQAICRKFNIGPTDFILIEHWLGDIILPEHWHLVRFNKIQFYPIKFEEPQWFRLGKNQIERLIGLQV